MKIAILGATSQIARDLILSFSDASAECLHLFARRPEEVKQWLVSAGKAGRYPADFFSEFDKNEFDAVINFVGVGDPAKVAAMGASISDITKHFDQMALDYLRTHPECRYLFLSSGVVYGSKFSAPADQDTPLAVVAKNPTIHEWYGVAKLQAEQRHRENSKFSIMDIRMFNYFSSTQDISARFFIMDILRAIRDKAVLKISPEYIVRDFLNPSDFHHLVRALLSAPASNMAVDCYSRAPIDKQNLLTAMQEKFGLQYEFADAGVCVNATGSKPYYYSLNRRAADFGYQPQKTSRESVLQESQKILSLQ